MKNMTSSIASLVFLLLLFMGLYHVQALETFLSDDRGGKRRSGDKCCSTESILITQGQMAPLPNGIPTYNVNIQNTCFTGCTICNIHVKCGWFSSARLINPNIFHRISYDDCLVNNGAPLLASQSIMFQYANIFPYHLSVSSVQCY